MKKLSTFIFPNLLSHPPHDYLTWHCQRKVNHLPLLNVVKENLKKSQVSFSKAGFANIRRICALASGAEGEMLMLSTILY